MINVTIGNNMGRTTTNFPEDTTLREAFESQNIDYSAGMNSLDGSTLQPGDLDKTFAELGITNRCHLMNVAKMQNAAAVKILGGSAVLESNYTLDQIRKVMKYRPKMLKIFEEKTEVFAVAVAKSGYGSANNNGVTFGVMTAGNAPATVTMMIPEAADKKAWVREEWGAAILGLKKVEEGLAAAIDDINAEAEAVSACITEV